MRKKKNENETQIFDLIPSKFKQKYLRPTEINRKSSFHYKILLFKTKRKRESFLFHEILLIKEKKIN